MSKEIERRVLQCSLQLRASSKPDSPGVLEGYASTYGTLSSDLGGFRETIAPGAFDAVIKDAGNCCALVNHDPNKVLGRVRAGTLKLRADDKGLWFSCQLPDTQDGRDIHTLVKRGDVNGCSFAFKLEDGDDEYTKSGGFTLRTVKNISHLYDVSAVCYPAYPTGTSVDARGFHYGVGASRRLSEEERLAVIRSAGRQALAIQAQESTPEFLRARANEFGRVIKRDHAEDVSNPESEEYDPEDPDYDPTLDSSSDQYEGDDRSKISKKEK